MLKHDRRVLLGDVELRGSASGRTAVGKAVVYNAWSEVLSGNFQERIAPGTFDAWLDTGPDVIATVDHDERRLLGRTASGTLRLLRLPDGIGVEVDIPPTGYGDDLGVSITRRDIRGMSFIFDVLSDEWSLEVGKRFRTVREAKLYEVSFVIFPAYPDTTAALRSLALLDHSANFRRKRLELASREV